MITASRYTSLFLCVSLTLETHKVSRNLTKTSDDTTSPPTSNTPFGRSNPWVLSFPLSATQRPRLLFPSTCYPWLASETQGQAWGLRGREWRKGPSESNARTVYLK